MFTDIQMIKKLIFTIIILISGFNTSLSAELIKNQVLKIDNLDRTYDLYIPSKPLTRPSPLVVLLHGHGGDANTITGQNRKSSPYKVWLSIAEREGWMLVIPDGEVGSDNKRGWNDCRSNASTNPDTDDVKFINALVDRVSIKYPIDKNRIYAHGTSNGGNMVFRLALESSERFRAVAAIVASMPEQSECTKPRAPTSVLIMNGTRDRILPYRGGQVAKKNTPNQERGTVISTSDAIQYWVDFNRTAKRPKIKVLSNIDRKDGSRVKVKTYSRGRGNTEVVLYKVTGGGHTEPSLTEHYSELYSLIVGRQNKDIEMVDEVWNFFERNQ